MVAAAALAVAAVTAVDSGSSGKLAQQMNGAKGHGAKGHGEGQGQGKGHGGNSCQCTHTGNCRYAQENDGRCIYCSADSTCTCPCEGCDSSSGGWTSDEGKAKGNVGNDGCVGNVGNDGKAKGNVGNVFYVLGMSQEDRQSARDHLRTREGGLQLLQCEFCNTDGLAPEPENSE